MPIPPDFSVISGAQVNAAISGREKQIIQVVESAYRLHDQGATINPDSYFLRFPDRPSARIIALPASFGDVHGIKWISSFPENVAAGLPRASAVLILNDAATGYPFACLESSIISATRTAASAALATAELSRRRGTRPTRAGFFGAGLIARYIHDYLVNTGFTFDEVGIHDLSPEHAAGFRDHVARSGTATTSIHHKAEDLIRSSELIVFATVASEPHVTDPAWFEHNPLVLNISLRDLSPEVILSSSNIVDDVEHCMKANTSPHLAEQLTGHRDFVTGTLCDAIKGEVTLPPDKPAVFSPFGLGILDLAVARYVYDQVRASGELYRIPDFFDELTRYGK